MSVATCVQVEGTRVMLGEGENFGNVTLESLACGVPIAAYVTGAGQSLRDGGPNGCAVTVGDEVALGEVLLGLLSRDSTDREAVRVIIEAYDQADMAAAYQALDQRMLGSEAR